MYTFNTPPGWPAPPQPGWQPPPGWQPDPSWPAPPPGWSFWLNSRGTRGLGPRGAYGALGRGRIVAAGGVGAAVLIGGLSLMAGGDDPASSGSPAAAATVTATVTVTNPPPAGQVTVTAPPRTLPRATVRVTVTARPPTVTVSRPAPIVGPTSESSTEEAYYPSCAAARRAGVTPLYTGDPGYSRRLDRDGDGVACEN